MLQRRGGRDRSGRQLVDQPLVNLRGNERLIRLHHDVVAGVGTEHQFCAVIACRLLRFVGGN